MKHFNKIYSWIGNQKILFGLFIGILVVPNIILSVTENVTLTTRICNVIFPLSVYWFLMTLSKKPGKTILWLSLIVFYDAFQLVLLDLFGESVIAVDMFLNLVTTNSGEASELLSNLLPAVIGVCLVYGFILFLGIISCRGKNTLSLGFRNKQRKLSSVFVGISSILILLNYWISPDFKIQNDIYPINVSYNVVLAVQRESKSSNYFNTSNKFRFNAKTSHDPSKKEIYLFVVGETARADNFGIYGYERNTTPNLEKIKDQLIIFKDVLTQSNTTHKSVPMLMTDASASNYDNLYYHKGIIEAFKEAGFGTYFFSNQRRNHSFIDYLGEEADKCVFIKDEYPDTVNVSDDELIKLVNNEINISKSNKIFIVLHTYGSHFNYKERYPKAQSYFKPDSITSVNKKYKKFLVNAYDNSIRYTDSFLSQLINIISKKSEIAGMIYTSDHGEDLFDDNRNLFLHASPVPTFYQIHVPYIIWLSEDYKKQNTNIVNNLINNRNKPCSSSLVNFYTILSIAGISGNYISIDNSLTNPNFKVEPRLYLNDHNLPMPLNKIGLKDKDEILFKKEGCLYR